MQCLGDFSSSVGRSLQLNRVSHGPSIHCAKGYYRVQKAALANRRKSVHLHRLHIQMYILHMSTQLPPAAFSERHIVHHLHRTLSSERQDDIAQRLGHKAGFAVGKVVFPLAPEELDVALGHAAVFG